MKPKTKTFVAMIDPENSGSAILGAVTRPTINKETETWYLEGDASINITDCGKIVQWEMVQMYQFRKQSSGYKLDKLRKVISIFLEMEQALESAQEEYLELRKEVLAHNKKNKEETE